MSETKKAPVGAATPTGARAGELSCVKYTIKRFTGQSDLFMQVRERVSAEEAARFYGLTFNNRGWAKCCFHNDNHPSMSFKNGRFHCWVCDLSGDSQAQRRFSLRPAS
jgi:hypothetical protein